MAASLVAITTSPNLETYWRAILAGDTTIIALNTNAAAIRGAGDFLPQRGNRDGRKRHYVEFAPGM